MKDAFENSFKKNLDNYELPYDSSAWDAMRAKLDAGASGASSNSFEQQIKDQLSSVDYPYNPAAWTALNNRLSGNKKGGKGKWYVAAGIAVVASVTAYLLITSDKENEATTTNRTSTTQQISSKPTATNTTIDGNQTVASNSVNSPVINSGINHQNANGATNSSSNVSNSTSATTSGSHNAGNTGNGSGEGTTTTASNDRNPGNSTHTSTTNPGDQNTEDRERNYVSPEIGVLCQGTSVKVENKNNYPLVISVPNGSTWSAPKNSTATFTPNYEGEYKVGYLKKNEFVEKEKFVVNATPKADFEFVDLSKKYLDGLPSLEVRANCSAQSYTWSYANGTESGETAEVHFYNKGVYPVTLTVKGANGCESTVIKTVNIDENYNLMANTGFYPTGTDSRTNTFMPFALTKRDVSFTMIILDPKDGHIVYETSDASKGWDGMDRQTGSLVQFETNYIWKVTIQNPAKGESSDYAGTILPLPK